MTCSISEAVVYGLNAVCGLKVNGAKGRHLARNGIKIDCDGKVYFQRPQFTYSILGRVVQLRQKSAFAHFCDERTWFNLWHSLGMINCIALQCRTR